MGKRISQTIKITRNKPKLRHCKNNHENGVERSLEKIGKQKKKKKNG